MVRILFQIWPLLGYDHSRDVNKCPLIAPNGTFLANRCGSSESPQSGQKRPELEPPRVTNFEAAMISQEQVQAVRKLLADGRYSQRDVAKLTGVSRGTIGAIASGQRVDRVRQPRERLEEPLGPIVRCPTCGGRVHAPCVLCRVRNLKAEERAERRRRADRDRNDADEILRRRSNPTPP
jgi:transcriptional regulator with XRE-family HTH domain